MLQDILWLDSGGTIIRGTGKQIQFKYVTPNRILFFFNYLMHMSRFLHHHGEFDCLILELQQLFNASEWKTQFLCG